MFRSIRPRTCAIAIALCLIALTTAGAANHREAPLTALDHKADIADFFAFVSYDDPSKVTFILTVDPLLEPSNGPNYFPFDPEILYEIKIDNDHDAVEDLTFQFRFKTEIRAPALFTGFAGAGAGIGAPDNSPPPVQPGTPIVPPAITALDGPGSEGFSLRQSYTVNLVREQTVPGEIPDYILRRLARVLERLNPQQRERYLERFRIPTTQLVDRPIGDGTDLYALPSNVGPRTMPDYEELFRDAVYDLDDARVFAGTVDDPFWIDLGGAFDTFNLNPMSFGSGVPGVLTDAEDAANENIAKDAVAGFNVNAIAIEVPIDLLTNDGARHDVDDALATIGAWGTTSRPRIREYGDPGLPPTTSGDFVQIQRMANPLFNELIIGTGSKDAFSMSAPGDDAQFADFALDPVLARVLNAAYDATVGPGVLPIPDPPRTDLLPLVQYLPPIAAPGTPPGPVADLLRLNTGVPPTPAGERNRLGLLAGDAAGFPNGRRLEDDVTDIALRAVLGVLSGPPFDGFPHNVVGDGVNVNDVAYRDSFPYLAPAHPGNPPGD